MEEGHPISQSPEVRMTSARCQCRPLRGSASLEPVPCQEAPDGLLREPLLKGTRRGYPAPHPRGRRYSGPGRRVGGTAPVSGALGYLTTGGLGTPLQNPSQRRPCRLRNGFLRGLETTLVRLPSTRPCRHRAEINARRYRASWQSLNDQDAPARASVAILDHHRPSD
jgi:hypothetical protein